MDGDNQRLLASAVAEAAQRGGHAIAAAESVTAGSVATALAAGAEASEWFKGSIVAYQTALKRDLLGVTEERVITPECAVQMMLGALAVTGADLAVSITGVGGPDPEEQQPAGTVFTCAGSRSGHSVLEHHFEGPPAAVVALATTAALRHLKMAVEGTAARERDTMNNSDATADRPRDDKPNTQGVPDQSDAEADTASGGAPERPDGPVSTTDSDGTPVENPSG